MCRHISALKRRQPKLDIIAVLGNHDYAQDQEREIASLLENVGVIVLGMDSAEGVRLDIRGVSVGIAGVKGFGGGFGIRDLSNFGEIEWRLIGRRIKTEKEKLETALIGLKAQGTDTNIALLHYAPVIGTIKNEHEQIYSSLGSSALKIAAWNGGADLILHGHAHKGPYAAKTANVNVRNVAYPLLKEDKRGSVAYFTYQGNRRWSDG